MKPYYFDFKVAIILNLAFLLLVGCGAPAKSVKTVQQDRIDLISKYYDEAYKQHFTGANKWMNGLSAYVVGMRKCNELANRKSRETCIDQLPKGETFLPADRKQDETLLEYTERKNDEWDEKECFYKGQKEARYLGDNQRIEDQCKRDLEVKRLRKAVEKLNSQNRQ